MGQALRYLAYMLDSWHLVLEMVTFPHVAVLIFYLTHVPERCSLCFLCCWMFFSPKSQYSVVKGGTLR